MAFRLPRRPRLSFNQPIGRWGNLVAIVALSALLASTTKAQAVGADQGGPAVTVNNSVLEQLGPPPVRKSPAKTASSIHLIPPKSRRASAAPARTSNTSHQKATISAPTKPAVAALAAPPPAARPSASSDAATQPVTAPQATRAEAPAPPSAPTIAGAPLTAAPAAPPSAAVPPKAAATAAPPVQMATATTVGNPPSALKFKPGVTDLGGGDRPVLDAVASRLLADENLRVQLVSHATGGANDAMEARRVSLARAVAVRAYLIDKGVRSLRIDVRALGNRADNGPAADQVELVLVSQ